MSGGSGFGLPPSDRLGADPLPVRLLVETAQGRVGGPLTPAQSSATSETVVARLATSEYNRIVTFRDPLSTSTGTES